MKKIKKYFAHLIMCFCVIAHINNVNADGLFNSIEENNQQDSRSSELSTPSDVVITEVVGDDDIGNSAGTGDAIGEILIQAMSLMGISYKWGGNTPETGMDCSGFIRYVFKKAMGITLPRTVAEMAKVGKRVSVDQMEPGDLMFFNTLRGRRNSHIGMYIGDNKFIQSPRTGQKIQITEYNSYWRSHTNGIKRIIQDDLNEGGEVKTFENVRNEALPSGYIKKPKKKAVTRKKSKAKVKKPSVKKVQAKKPSTKKVKPKTSKPKKAKSTKKIVKKTR